MNVCFNFYSSSSISKIIIISTSSKQTASPKQSCLDFKNVVKVKAKTVIFQVLSAALSQYFHCVTHQMLAKSNCLSHGDLSNSIGCFLFDLHVVVIRELVPNCLCLLYKILDQYWYFIYLTKVFLSVDMIDFQQIKHFVEHA